ncbi:hypothetical protein ABD76_24665 [Paenibacillus dendritiformis]|nr:hypothetical protein [Paenibacillus dendritiformis]
MKFGKTIVGMVAIMACVSVATAAFADTKSVKLTGYGQLKGTLEGRYYETSVTDNPDNAILTIEGTIQDKNGKTLIGQKKLESRRGDRSLSGYWSGLPSNAYAIYGAHGVKGGSKHKPGVVYTVTHIK